MSTYKNLIGKDVNFLTTDPDNDAAEGQIWYNSTAGVFKDLIVNRAWAASGPMLTARGNGGAAGTSTSAFVASGYTTTGVANTEEYNGTGFSTGGNVNTARPQTAGAGTETAGLIAGGFEPPSTGKTEEYNGTSWSEQNDMNIARRTMSGSAGTQTAALFFGGYRDITPTPNGVMNSTESYNGTSWTSESALNTAVWQNTGSGIQTAAVSVGGPPTQTEHYDGSSWTTDVAINTARLAAGAAGTTSNTLFYGGTTDGGDGGISAKTEEYDGTSWTEVADMAVARRGLGKAGEYNKAVAMGGLGPAKSDTEEFTSSINVITAAAWASGGALPGSGRQGYGVGTGTQTATIAAGGPPTSTQNQFYDGSAWTNLASIPAGVTDSQGFGDSEELLMAGGNSGAPYSALTYVYSRPGNSWTAVASPGNINTARALGAGCGALSTAGIIAGGNTPSYTTATESWNGSAWTTVNALPTATGNGVGSCGTQTAGLIWSGQNPGDPTAEETYEWDGTNWTSGGNRLIGVRAVRGGAGTQTAALTFGGWLDPGGSVSTEGYDGTSWSTRPNMAGAAANNFQTGTQTAALRAGGTDGPGYTAVEEFTGETSALNIKTITTS